MLSILINSYTCCPGMGSEQGMGWNWIVHLAKYCDLHIISEGEYRDIVETATRWPIEEENGDDSQMNVYGLTRQQCSHLHFYWNPIGGDDKEQCDIIRSMCWNQGDWRFYLYYKVWQQQVADIAREICSERHIDILHQLNMIGFREPGYLWQVSQETGIPFVWGPIGGMKQFPMAYASGLKMKAFNWLKNTINVWQIRHDKRVEKALSQASVLISSIPDSYNAIRWYKHKESVLIPETGCFLEKESFVSKESRSTFTVMWVGKFDYRKRLDIALRAIALIDNPNIILKVFGTGNETQMAEVVKLVDDLDIKNRVFLMGVKSNAEIKVEMRKSALFLFTSVNEDTSTVVLEAVSNQLPVVCFDCCGMAKVIDEQVGIKIPLTTPKRSISDFARVISELYQHKERLVEMSANCKVRAEELSWDKKTQKVVALYHQVVAGIH